ncbi:unnamed protein product [Trifolium pratense]|uniref:Uncharacterized protein n=1 Tax=Trifolium pratense TaxID=57577 RepID=A0ACB0I7S7_TRIPR|nr:unnamed protein product [Trifolium pratense]
MLLAKGQYLTWTNMKIMQRVEINASDLRILDPFLSYPSILGRDNTIVLNLELIKAIITAEELESPFEFRAMEMNFLPRYKHNLFLLSATGQRKAVLYLSRKAGSTSPVSGGSGAANWFSASPTIGSKISRASIVTGRFNENDVEEIEMLLESLIAKP